ncbi:MAG: hypothetical protein C5B55_03365 [Blastocatellia bacterium]|nr:MAG: hypothetical protein C5B55_03365 [Blastocatellia bacterium]
MVDVQNLKGWVPIDAVVSEGRPGLLWMNANGEEFSEPFFQQTVERLRTKQPKPIEWFSDFDAALQLEKLAETIKPDGFIFHSSRCGSTLISNALRCIKDAIVVSEASAIDKLVVRLMTDAGKESIYSVILRAVVSAFGQRRTGDERRLFVKWSCCSTSQVQRIRRIWPNVPCVFLYRDPVETAVSNLTTKPEWLLDPDRRVLAAIIGVSIDTIRTMSDEELCVRSIASFYSAAQQLANDRSLLLNYRRLSTSRILSALEFFNVEASREEADAIQRATAVYSKDASQSLSFVNDSDMKRRSATKLVRDLVEQWAVRAYDVLEQTEAQVDKGW